MSLKFAQKVSEMKLVKNYIHLQKKGSSS